MSAARVSVAVAVAAVLIACATGARAAPPRENAKAMFQEGERNFQLGKFEAAIEAYERAFNLDPHPAFIFNIALAHRRQYEIDGKLEHLLRARELYRNYLKLAPATANRAGVEKLITELGTRIDQARAGAVDAPPVAAAVPAPPPPPVAAPPVASPPPVAPPPVATTPAPVPVIAATPPPALSPRDEKSSSTRTWLIAGGIAAVLIGAAATILLVTRSDPSFDGPGIDLTPP